MEFLINALGLLNCAYTCYNRQSRLFFCVCDKINIYEKTPQCVFGAFCHLLALILPPLSLASYSIYPLSLWSFMLFLSSIYYYKSTRELCINCILAFLTASLALFYSYAHLLSFPWILAFIYFSILLLNLCLTSAALSVKPKSSV